MKNFFILVIFYFLKILSIIKLKFSLLLRIIIIIFSSLNLKNFCFLKFKTSYLRLHLYNFMLINSLFIFPVKNLPLIILLPLIRLKWKKKKQVFYIQNYGNVSSIQYDFSKLPFNITSWWVYWYFPFIFYIKFPTIVLPRFMLPRIPWIYIININFNNFKEKLKFMLIKDFIFSFIIYDNQIFKPNFLVNYFINFFGNIINYQFYKFLCVKSNKFIFNKFNFFFKEIELYYLKFLYLKHWYKYYLLFIFNINYRITFFLNFFTYLQYFIYLITTFSKYLLEFFKIFIFVIKNFFLNFFYLIIYWNEFLRKSVLILLYPELYKFLLLK